MSIHLPHVDLPPKKFRKQINSERKFGFEDSSHDIRDSVIAVMDWSIHKVIDELKKQELYDNSVVLVTTDNGGGPNYSNAPLKGTKETVYEGGIRGVSFLLSPLLKMSGYKYSGLIHLSDWVPTLARLAGVPVPTDLDGQDLWDSLSNNLSSPRTHIFHNIDQDKDKGTWQVKI